VKNRLLLKGKVGLANETSRYVPISFILISKLRRLGCIHSCNVIAESAVTLSSSRGGSCNVEQDIKQTNRRGKRAD
jgi:hypothetical protein